MIKKSSLICFLEILLLNVFYFLNIFIFKTKSNYVFCLAYLILIVVSFFLLGYEKANYRNKKDIIFTLITNIIIFFIITYILGIVVGFYKNAYSLRLIHIITNSFSYLILILLREFFRYLYYCKAKKNIILYILGILSFVLLDISMYLHLYNMWVPSGMTKMICFIIFPSIARNIFLSYLTTKVGYENAIFYSVIMELKKFVLPIFPDFGPYLNTIVEVTFPLYLTLNIHNKFLFNEKRRIKNSRYQRRNLIFYSIITFFLFTIIMLTSGYFKYYALTIGSASMSPTINKGDVVIVKKIDKKNADKKLKKGDVLVYNYDDKIIVHRLVKKSNLNGEYYYVTKGDNNHTKDGWSITKKDIIGTVCFRIRFIGYPTVSLNEKIEREG